MPKFILMLCLLVSGLLSGGCSATRTADADTIYVSILPLRGLIREIVGDDFEVKVLVPPGANPETFELSARQLSELHRADLVFNVGLIPFEQTLLAELDDRTVDLSRGVSLLDGACAHGHHDAHGTDPHIWTSPKALKQMAKTAFAAIRAIRPDSAVYARRHDLLQQKLDRLDDYVRGRIESSGTRYFIIYHPALTYYAADYGIGQQAVEDEGKEPSARYIARLIEQARADGVRRIFCQAQFPKTAVEIIASDINAEIVVIDPLAEDVVDNLKRITDLITEQ